MEIKKSIKGFAVGIGIGLVIYTATSYMGCESPYIRHESEKGNLEEVVNPIQIYKPSDKNNENDYVTQGK